MCLASTSLGAAQHSLELAAEHLKVDNGAVDNDEDVVIFAGEKAVWQAFVRDSTQPVQACQDGYPACGIQVSTLHPSLPHFQ